MLGKRLKELRKSRRLTQQELGEALGISASAIGMYEQGRRDPDHRTLTALCRYFAVSSDYFLMEEQPVKAPPSPELEELIADFRRRLLEQDGLLFNGMPLSEQDVAMVVSAMEVGASVAVNKLTKKDPKVP